MLFTERGTSLFFSLASHPRTGHISTRQQTPLSQQACEMTIPCATLLPASLDRLHTHSLPSALFLALSLALSPVILLLSFPSSWFFSPSLGSEKAACMLPILQHVAPVLIRVLCTYVPNAAMPTANDKEQKLINDDSR